MAVLFLGADNLPVVGAHDTVLIAYSLAAAHDLLNKAGLRGHGRMGHIAFRQATVLVPYWMMARERVEFVPPGWVHSLRASAVAVGEPDAIRILRAMAGADTPGSTSLEDRALKHNAARLLKAAARLGEVAVLEPELPPGVHKVTDHRQRNVRIRK